MAKKANSRNVQLMIGLRLTPEEKAEIVGEAKKYGMTIGYYFRLCHASQKQRDDWNIPTLRQVD